MSGRYYNVVRMEIQKAPDHILERIENFANGWGVYSREEHPYQCYKFNDSSCDVNIIVIHSDTAVINLHGEMASHFLHDVLFNGGNDES